MRVALERAPLMTFSQAWEALGPFQIGTREATWGADPLERFGGFRSLPVDKSRKFASSLATNGQISWSTFQATLDKNKLDVEPGLSENVSLQFNFPGTDWQALSLIYGLPALQWQAWARGHLTIHGVKDVSVMLYIDNVLEYWIDECHVFGGDYYAYRRAPHVIRLAPGDHMLNVRLIRDVRVMGSSIPPDLGVQMAAVSVHEGLIFHSNGIVAPETVQGRPAGTCISVPATNTSQQAIVIESVKADERSYSENDCLSPNLGGSSLPPTPSSIVGKAFPILIAPGQTRPVILHITPSKSRVSGFCLQFTSSDPNLPRNRNTQVVECLMKDRSLHDPHRVTYLHPNGSVSYALLQPPPPHIIQQMEIGRSLPVALLLHGAGADVDGPEAQRIFETWPELPAWTLLPSGVTSWASDDWHGLGIQDIESAIESLDQWAETVKWKGPRARKNAWFVVGHSNGGQGAWHLLTHRPDKIIGAAPISGYSSIEAYVPYSLWSENDCAIGACVSKALQDSRHEALLANVGSIPTHIQHGSEDDNVPVFHSRRMYQLLSMNPSSNVKYYELAGKGHWFDGVLTTQNLVCFYQKILRNPEHPKLPPAFDITISTPTSLGPKGGLKVDLLIEPGRLGRIQVRTSAQEWAITTFNVLQFHFVDGPYFEDISLTTNLDGQRFTFLDATHLLATHFHLGEKGTWKATESGLGTLETRSKGQRGSLDSILQSRSTFFIISHTSECHNTAIQISRNLYQYFAADAAIVAGNDEPGDIGGNIITLAMGIQHNKLRGEKYPVSITKSGVAIKRANESLKVLALEAGMGAIFLSPLTEERLEIIIWGVDSRGLSLAARLFPLLTGVGQPEFVIVSEKCGWQGAGGVKAMGTFTNAWQASKSSFI